jgi:hypothetical protein
MIMYHLHPRRFKSPKPRIQERVGGYAQILHQSINLPPGSRTAAPPWAPPPAPPYANLYCAIFEDPIITSYPEIDIWRRFIDDGLSIWLTHPDPATDAQRWQSYQNDMNARFGGLQWTFSPRSNTIDFMDLTIVIQGSRVTTTLFEKAMNLHLYSPPHSAHPPGVLPGLVLGMIYRIQWQS